MAAVSLLGIYAYERATAPGRVVRGRILAVPAASAAGSLLIRPDVVRGLARFLPLSASARAGMAAGLERAGSSLRVSEFVSLRLVHACVGFIAGSLVLLTPLPPMWSWPAMALLAWIGWLWPRLSMERRAKNRRAASEARLADALISMAKALRSGTGLYQALEYTARETSGPLGEELARACRDLQLGEDPEQALGSLSRRLGSPEFDIAITAILVQRTVGGGLAETLSNVASTVRDRAKLNAEIRAITAQQRLSSTLIAFIPFVIAGIFYLLQPQVAPLLVTTTIGRIALGLAVALEIAGLVLIRRLAVIDV
jgi:tight adherence protein B